VADAPARDDFACPGLTSIFRWISAFLDASGSSLTLVDRSQPAKGVMLMPNPVAKTDNSRALAGFRCRMVGIPHKNDAQRNTELRRACHAGAEAFGQAVRAPSKQGIESGLPDRFSRGAQRSNG
jgi:hypothetical protein